MQGMCFACHGPEQLDEGVTCEACQGINDNDDGEIKAIRRETVRLERKKVRLGENF
jgi:hypothetical protein